MKILKGSRKNIEMRGAQLIARKIRGLARIQNQIILGIPGGTSV